MTAAETKQSQETDARPQKITTFLMFEKDSVKAAKFYVSIFKNSQITSILPGPDGSEMGATFILDGTPFSAYDGGDHFSFTEGMSLMINAETQDEIDYFWEKLSEDGEKKQCGWVADKFGVSWQITPPILLDLIANPDREKAKRAFDAMLEMTKIDIAKIEEAAAGE